MLQAGAVFLASWAGFQPDSSFLPNPAAACPRAASAEDGSAQKAVSGGGDISSRIKKMSPQEQLDYLEKLEKSGHADGKTAFYKGNAFYALGKVDSAIAQFKKSVEANPDFSKALVNLGLAYDTKGKFPEAEVSFLAALKANPEDVLARCHLGYLYYSRQQYEKAMDHFRSALKMNPESAQAHYYMGLAFADAHIFKEAQLEWETVARLKPNSELGQTALENVKLIKQYLTVKTP